MRFPATLPFQKQIMLMLTSWNNIDLYKFNINKLMIFNKFWTVKFICTCQISSWNLKILKAAITATITENIFEFPTTFWYCWNHQNRIVSILQPGIFCSNYSSHLDQPQIFIWMHCSIDKNVPYWHYSQKTSLEICWAAMLNLHNFLSFKHLIVPAWIKCWKAETKTERTSISPNFQQSRGSLLIQWRNWIFLFS